MSIRTRVLQLGVDQFDFSRSAALRVGSSEEAVNIERMLHRAFAKYRIPATDVEAFEGHRPDGATEWFDTACTSRLKQFLSENEDLLGFSTLDSTAVQTLVGRAKSAKHAAAPECAEASEPAELAQPKKKVRAPLTDEEVNRRTVARRESRRARRLHAAQFEEQDIAGACHQADSQLLPALRLLIKHCNTLCFIRYNSGPPFDVVDELVGELPLDAPREAHQALSSLNRLIFSGEGANIGLTIGFSTSASTGGVLFGVRLRCHPNINKPKTRMELAVLAHVAAYPLSIPGWASALNDEGEAQARNILACLPRRSDYFHTESCPIHGAGPSWS